MESIISTFHIDWKIIIAQVVNFGIVFLVLYYFALKPLAVLMLERTGKIEKGVKDAKLNAEVLEKTQAEYERMLAKAREEADKIFQSGKKEAEAKRSAMLAEANNEVTSMVEGGKKVLAAEKSKMVDEAKKEIATLATLAAERILNSKDDLAALK